MSDEMASMASEASQGFSRLLYWKPAHRGKPSFGSTGCSRAYRSISPRCGLPFLGVPIRSVVPLVFMTEGAVMTDRAEGSMSANSSRIAWRRMKPRARSGLSIPLRRMRTPLTRVRRPVFSWTAAVTGSATIFSMGQKMPLAWSKVGAMYMTSDSDVSGMPAQFSSSRPFRTASMAAYRLLPQPRPATTTLFGLGLA